MNLHFPLFSGTKEIRSSSRKHPKFHLDFPADTRPLYFIFSLFLNSFGELTKIGLRQYTHPAIHEAPVVGRADEFWGETPCAFVV